MNNEYIKMLRQARAQSDALKLIIAEQDQKIAGLEYTLDLFCVKHKELEAKFTSLRPVAQSAKDQP
jgi:hypothetical protein